MNRAFAELALLRRSPRPPSLFLSPPASPVALFMRVSCVSHVRLTHASPTRRPPLPCSPAGFVGMLDEADDVLQAFALTKINAHVDQFWAEIADSLTKMCVAPTPSTPFPFCPVLTRIIGVGRTL